MLLSVREVVDIADQCFAAAGFDQGTARANAAAIWWAEAYHGSGVETLHGLLEPLERFEVTTPQVERRDAPISSIRNAGKPCLWPAVPALDLACARADAEGVGITLVSESNVSVDGDTLGALAYRGAERGYDSFAISVDSAGNSRADVSSPCESGPAHAARALPEPPVVYDAVERADRMSSEPPSATTIREGLFGESTADVSAGPVDERLLHQLVRRSVTPATEGSAGRGAMLVCIDSSEPEPPEAETNPVHRIFREKRQPFDSQFSPEQSQTRISRLTRRGVEVEEAIWRDIFEFSNRILAPPFEGSEKGAGFDLNDLDQ